jgi:hypothetical protein
LPATGRSTGASAGPRTPGHLSYGRELRASFEKKLGE